jgi:hypothetical protein
MATSYVSFNEGTARKVRTFQRTDGATTVEEWMYAETEPVLDAYTVSAVNVAGVTADSHVLQIMAGASLRVGIRRITIYQYSSSNTTRQVRFGVHRLTSAGTGGTAVTPLPLDPASGAVGATAMTLPTGKGTEISGAVGGVHIGVIQSNSINQGSNPLLDIDFGYGRERALWIAAGTSNGICVKNLVADSSVTYNIVVRLVEAGWA